jgi:hypothetical protein
MPIKFKERTLHGKREFLPKVVYDFEDPDAAPYFKALGAAEDAADNAKVDVHVTAEELDIDPDTVFASSNFGERRGEKILGSAE